MATTTTNYGWTVPQSSDLVKDGATAIATLGNDIDGYIAGSSASGKLFFIAGTDSTSTAQTTTSTTFVDKTDCEVTFTTGKSGVFMVVLTANVMTATAGTGASASYRISGGATVAADSSRAVITRSTDRMQASVMRFFDGTPNTSTTVTLAMQSGSGSVTATVNDASIQVVCFG
jgi:hypothetical protein